jgi:N-acetyl-gamma-glutamyl-phosphate reductase/acetylglutamate kinase
VRQFEANGRIPRSYIPVGPSAPPHRAGGADGARVLDVRPPLCGRRQCRVRDARGGARSDGDDGGVEEGGVDRRARVHGAALTSLFSAHPTLDLSHGSSRQLAGFSPDEYTMAPATYGNLSPTNVQRMEAEGAVDAWVLVLPNGAGAPFVAALDKGAKARGDGGSVAVDLSATRAGGGRTGSRRENSV